MWFREGQCEAEGTSQSGLGGTWCCSRGWRSWDGKVRVHVRAAHVTRAEQAAGGAVATRARVRMCECECACKCDVDVCLVKDLINMHQHRTAQHSDAVGWVGW